MSARRAASMIGLAMKAGKVAGGEFAAEKALRQGKGQLVILSEDASANTRKKFGNMANSQELPLCNYLPKAELGSIIGKGERSCLVITDEGFARKIALLIEEENTDQTGKVVENIGKYQNS